MIKITLLAKCYVNWEMIIVRSDLPMRFENDARDAVGCGDPAIFDSSRQCISASCKRVFKWFACFTKSGRDNRKNRREEKLKKCCFIASCLRSVWHVSAKWIS